MFLPRLLHTLAGSYLTRYNAAGMSSNAGTIQFEQLTVAFGTAARTVIAVEQISLEIAAGSFVALVGPSGSGKSTLLRAAGGLITPTSGHIRVGGRSATAARLARQVSFVFQQPVLLAWHTAQANVEVPLRIFGWSRAERQRAAQQSLELVGLSRFAHAYPHQLSGGMQQRVALARALAFAPSVLLMDEPFAALDEITRERLNGELLNIWAQTNATVLFVTHSLAEAAFLADEVVVLSAHPGRIIARERVPLPRPRTAEMLVAPELLACVARLRQHLARSFAEPHGGD